MIDWFADTMNRREVLEATVGVGAAMALAGCSGDGNDGGGTTSTDGDGSGGTTSTDGDGSGSLALPEDAVSELSLTEVGRETVSGEGGEVEIVAYRRDREPSTAVESFATNIDDSLPPVGRSVLASEFGVDEVPFPAEGSPTASTPHRRPSTRT